jgi:hypothetical protein
MTYHIMHATFAQPPLNLMNVLTGLTCARPPDWLSACPPYLVGCGIAHRCHNRGPQKLEHINYQRVTWLLLANWTYYFWP